MVWIPKTVLRKNDLLTTSMQQLLNSSKQPHPCTPPTSQNTTLLPNKLCVSYGDAAIHLREFVQNYRHPDLRRECSGVACTLRGRSGRSASCAGRATKSCFGGPLSQLHARENGKGKKRIGCLMYFCENQ